jgi:glycosyltransferase involved in cell wall biosynthesis
MISVVMATLNNGATLADALAPLVKGAIDGLIKEVVLADGGSDDATLEIAEDAGARVLSLMGGYGRRLAAGCHAARGEWLFLLPPRRLLIGDWDHGVRGHLDAGGGAAEVVASRGAVWPWRTREGVLVPVRAYADAGGLRDVAKPEADLMDRLSGGGLRRLPIGL